MQHESESYEVVSIVLPEEAAGLDPAIPRTILVRIYENECLAELDRAIQNFVKVEKPRSCYRTIPVGSAEDFVEYWIEFPRDATEIADRLRDRLDAAYTRSTRAFRPSAPGGSIRRPDGLAA